MRKKPTFEQWLKDFEAVIEAPHPRRAKTPLMRCEMSWPGCGTDAVLTVEVFEKILGALVRLRYSRCFGRVDAEVRMMEKLGWVVNDLMFFDRPPDQSGELFTVEAAPVPERTRNLAILRLAAEYAAEAFVDRPPREAQTHRRVNESLILLDNLMRRKELRGLIEGIVVKLRRMIAGVEDDSTRAGIEFLQSYYDATKPAHDAHRRGSPRPRRLRPQRRQARPRSIQKVVMMRKGFVIGLLCVATVVGAKQPVANPKEELLTLDNGSVKIGIDRAKGASITHLSWSTNPKNIVNAHDPGRLIQQSYYAGKMIDRQSEGQHKAWSPWSWNPIQGGGVGSWARVTEFKRLDENTLYGETVPKLWDMPDEEAAATMRQWIRFEPAMPNTIAVTCELVVKRQPGDRWGPAHKSPQEIPATYFTRNFDQFKSYTGADKWRELPKKPGPPWSRAKSARKAIACFDKAGQGVAIFSPNAENWNYGPHAGPMTDDPLGGPCVHIAPVMRVLLGPRSTLKYRYWLVTGTSSEIAAQLDTLWKKYKNERAELTNP